MFSRVASIQDCGVYKKYSWPEELPNFSTRNLIYGWNYCGKTTLSRIFRTMEVGRMASAPAGSRYSLELDGGLKFGEADVGKSVPATVRVFNADFVEENLLWGGGAQPLLILGAESIQLDTERDSLEKSLVKASDWQGRVESRRRRCEAKRDEALSAIALKVKLKTKLVVFHRTPHLAAVLEACRGDYAQGLLGEDDLVREKSTYESEERRALPKAQVPPFDLGDSYELFGKTASRIAIASLSANDGLERWVFQGLSLHGANKECGFCGNRVSQTRWDLLEAHFSRAVTELLSSIDLASKRLSDFRMISLPATAELYEDLRRAYSDLALALKRIEERIVLRLADIRVALNEKKSRVEEAYKPLRRPVGRLLALRDALVGRINGLIDEHNRRVTKGVAAREEAKRRLVLHYACSGMITSDVSKLQKELNFLSGWASRTSGIRQGIESRLSFVKRKIEAASIGTEKVNQYIRMYFGSDRLRVATVSGRYRVYRESQVATTLSEGEKTAISFAYFMARLEESDVALSRTVVYIDDPVSSLDANHIFNTFSIIRAKLSTCAQLFVSTHHYEFFRLMKDDSFFREWGDKRSLKRRTSYYRVVRTDDESRIEDLPLALRKYSSEYQLLVSTLFDFESGKGLPPHLIPNVLRRVLEAYSSFRFPSAVETLDHRLGKIFPDPVLAARIYKLVNHLSHAGSPNVIFELPPEEEVQDVTGIVLARLREFDHEHFGGLESVLCAPD